MVVLAALIVGAALSACTLILPYLITLLTDTLHAAALAAR
jgi:hypothetical protein